MRFPFPGQGCRQGLLLRCRVRFLSLRRGNCRFSCGGNRGLGLLSLAGRGRFPGHDDRFYRFSARLRCRFGGGGFAFLPVNKLRRRRRVHFLRGERNRRSRVRKFSRNDHGAGNCLLPGCGGYLPFPVDGRRFTAGCRCRFRRCGVRGPRRAARFLPGRSGRGRGLLPIRKNRARDLLFRGRRRPGAIHRVPAARSRDGHRPFHMPRRRSRCRGSPRIFPLRRRRRRPGGRLYRPVWAPGFLFPTRRQSLPLLRQRRGVCPSGSFPKGVLLR